MTVSNHDLGTAAEKEIMIEMRHEDGAQMKERDMDKNFSDSFLTGGIAGEHHLM